jgi:protocatechuate 3,4-dioxygenase beta subunit
MLKGQPKLRSITEQNLTKAVLATVNADDPRLQEVLSSLIEHLHAYIREVEPTEEEWFKTIDFLTRTGQMCDDRRQEFILLSDVLGVSMLVDAINHRTSQSATDTTVTGPFHAKAPSRENGANIAQGPEWERGETTVVNGRITDVEGNPIAGALVDVWQADDGGYYDVQDTNQPETNLRGLFTTDERGEFWFRTVKPSSYPIPDDGPVGELLAATGRHPMRPAHIHFMISAPGYRRLVTHLFVEGDQYLESDAVFGVKDSLVIDFIRHDSEEKASAYGITAPFYLAEYDFVLEPVA